MDQDTLDVLSEESLNIYLRYGDQLKSLFISFLHPNYNAGKKVISWKEIEEKNLTLICRCFLKLARTNFLIPHMFNVESL